MATEWIEPRYLRQPWAEFLGKLDDAQYPIEVVTHSMCHARSALSAFPHVCAAVEWPEVGFAVVLTGDVEDILTYRQV